MKKLIVFAIIVLVACIFTGCNSCTHTFKNLESDFSELDRDVVVLHPFTGDTLFTYSGPCYITNDSSNNVTLIFKVNGKSRKADWSNNVIFQAVEK